MTFDRFYKGSLIAGIIACIAGLFYVTYDWGHFKGQSEGKRLVLDDLDECVKTNPYISLTAEICVLVKDIDRMLDKK